MKWSSMKQEGGSRGTIRSSLAYLMGKRFSFRGCPEILAMVEKAAGTKNLQGPSYDFHENELRIRLAPETTLVGMVGVVERYLDSLSERETPRRRIVNELRELSGRQFSFEECPDILELVAEADPRLKLHGSAKYQLQLKREREIRDLIGGLRTIDEKVVAVEQHIASISGGTSQNTPSPFVDKAPKLDGWGNKG